MTTEQARFEIRRDSAAGWLAVNPVLLAGEPGFEEDTGKHKIGDGATAWSALPYFIDETVLRGTFLPFGTPSQDAPGLGLYFPEAHGAAATYDAGVDDSAAVQAACAAAAAGNGRVWLNRPYNCPAGIAEASTVTVTGVTGNLAVADASGTPLPIAGIVVSAGNVTGLDLSGPGSDVHDIAVVCTSGTMPTAGSAVKFSGGGMPSLHHCTLVGFYDVVHISAQYYRVSDNNILDPVHYGVLFDVPDANYNDHGDMKVHSNNILSFFHTYNAQAAIHWSSGGGLIAWGNKINGAAQVGNASAGTFVNGIEVILAAGVSTSDIQIYGNSIENCTGNFVHVAVGGATGTLSNLQIHNNELGWGRPINAALGYAISVNGNNGAGARNISEIQIHNNFIVDTGKGIFVDYCEGATIGPHRYRMMNGGVGLTIGSNAIYTTVDWAGQSYDGDGPIVQDDSATNRNANGTQQSGLYVLSRDVPNITSTSVYSTLWRVGVPMWCGGILTVTIAGQVNGAGTFTQQFKRMIHRDNAAVTLTTIGTDVSDGVAVDVQMATPSGGGIGEFQVQLKRNSAAGGTAIQGTNCTVRVEGGMLATIRKGA